MKTVTRYLTIKIQYEHDGNSNQENEIDDALSSELFYNVIFNDSINLNDNSVVNINILDTELLFLSRSSI